MSEYPDGQPAKHKTCRRYNEPGHAHTLTFSCFKRRPFLSRDRSRLWFLHALAAAREQHHFHVWAYVIMPEHVHLLICPMTDVYSISDILLDIKRPVARQAVAYVRRHAPHFLERMRDQQPNGRIAHRFWQRGGGYDRNLVNPETVLAQINYIHANPVRRGLVTDPADWPWSSAGYFAGREDVLFAPDTQSIPTSGSS